MAFNDAEIAGLKKGEKIIVPDGEEKEVPIVQVARNQINTTTTNNSYRSAGYGSNSFVSASAGPVFAGNRYAWGNCTWHVYNLRAAAGKPIPSFWGDGGMWGYSARADGYTISNKPIVGSIAWRTGGYGHVAYVTEVKGNSVHVKEMHGFNGPGIAREADYPISSWNGFIY